MGALQRRGLATIGRGRTKVALRCGFCLLISTRAGTRPWPKFCGAARVAPGFNGPCNPVSAAVIAFERQQAAGWSPGRASSRCEPLGPDSRGAEHCVSCDAAGNCSETVVRPKVDPTIAEDA